MIKITDVLETLWAFQRVLTDATLGDVAKKVIAAELLASLPPTMLCAECSQTRAIVENFIRAFIDASTTEASEETPAQTEGNVPRGASNVRRGKSTR